jgi:subtilisin family serine protease
MSARGLSTPWLPHSAGYAIPGTIILKLRVGEAPKHVPTRLDVQRRLGVAAEGLDGGPIDRLLRHHGRAAQITRVYAAAKSLNRFGERHVGFNDIEHALGMAATFHVEVDRGAPIGTLVGALQQIPAVENATPHWLTTVPFDTAVELDSDAAWDSRSRVCAADALAYETGDSAIVVAIVDSGIAPVHPEFVDRWRAGFDTVQLRQIDLAAGVSLMGPRARFDTRPYDEYVGHGMGCAGIIGATGAAIPPGLCGACQLLPIRVLGAARLPGRTEPVGIGAIADIDCGMKIAVDLGAKVINMSFGTPDSALGSDGARPHEDVVRYALAHGCVLVAASGNSGQNEKYWPAAFEGVIAVGATDSSGRPARFTTSGEHVGLCAPGERIITTALRGYQSVTGTSFAAPFVAGAAALLVSRAERRAQPLDGLGVRELLVQTANPFPMTPSAGYGSGVLNASAALEALDHRIDSLESLQPEATA